MKYDNIIKAKFISRPNRFIANIEINGKVEVCHVKNTGRCKELLIPGRTIYVQHFNKPERKTNYDLISVEKDKLLINMDSQAPNKVVLEWLKEGGLFSSNEIKMIKPEVKYGNSRFDIYVETNTEKIFIEVKGVTLENNMEVSFPDAPTIRGLKHINELVECTMEGYKAYVIFVVQMENPTYFTPNDTTQPEFRQALIRARDKGVNILAFDCRVSTDSLNINKPVRVEL